MARKSAAEQITDQLRKDIIIRKYKLNEHLVEAKISSDLEVSITPVRQAFMQLAREGLLVVYPYRGVCVTDIDEKLVNDVKAVRCMIELEAAKTSYENMVERDSECLMNIIRRAEILDLSDIYDALCNDINFHECIVRYANNSILLELWKTISSRVMLLQSYTKPRGQFLVRDFQKKHLAMAEAVAYAKGEMAFHQAHFQNLQEAFSEPELQKIRDNIF